jgi:hypothetical protein
VRDARERQSRDLIEMRENCADEHSCGSCGEVAGILFPAV